jgi:hypothetical protein
MPSTLSIEEGVPEEGYPVIAVGSGPQAAKIVETAWQRVESWIAHRWGERPVTFIVEGPGEWVPPLRPFTVYTIEAWIDNTWVSAVVAPSPLGGFCLDRIGPFRFIGDLGSTDEPPRAVKEAVFRLAEYYCAVDDVSPSERPLSKFKTSAEPVGDDGGAASIIATIEREQSNPNWIARAMQLSGAADLLRPWRKLGSR